MQRFLDLPGAPQQRERGSHIGRGVPECDRVEFIRGPSCYSSTNCSAHTPSNKRHAIGVDAPGPGEKVERSQPILNIRIECAVGLGTITVAIKTVIDSQAGNALFGPKTCGTGIDIFMDGRNDPLIPAAPKL
nr:hypothetical protein [Pseudomonas sp. B28(2017)]